jgi:hypothetical protein
VRWPSGRRRWFAKRKSASRISLIFLVNPSLSSTSQIDRVGWRWFRRRCFGASQGQSWGEFQHATCSDALLKERCEYHHRPLQHLRSAHAGSRSSKTSLELDTRGTEMSAALSRLLCSVVHAEGPRPGAAGRCVWSVLLQQRDRVDAAARWNNHRATPALPHHRNGARRAHPPAHSSAALPPPRGEAVRTNRTGAARSARGNAWALRP